jgi:hypothetical protein
MLALLGRGFWRLPRKSCGPPLFAPSLNVKGDDTHNNSGFSVTPSIAKQLPGPVRMAMGTSVFRIRIELIFRRCWNPVTPWRSAGGVAGSGPRLNPVNIDPKNGAAAQKRSF